MSLSVQKRSDLAAGDTLKAETLLALAVRVGKTRLIDNCVLGKAEKP